MQGPGNLVIRDENGENPHVEASTFFPLEPDDQKVEYLTWDGQLTAAYDEIHEMWAFLMKTAEISPALFGGEFGRAESGAAMKRLMLQTIIKVNRLRISFDPAIKKLLYLYSEVALKMGIEDAVLLDSVDIQWRDGIPQDVTEEVQAETMAVAGGISSVEAAVGKVWNKQGEDLAEELKRIDSDKKKKVDNALAAAPPVPFGGNRTGNALRVNDVKSTIKKPPANPTWQNT